MRIISFSFGQSIFFSCFFNLFNSLYINGDPTKSVFFLESVGSDMGHQMSVFNG
ncbi:hypothetical protein Hanom_Chr06g00519601 [Helianthus anomalus]